MSDCLHLQPDSFISGLLTTTVSMELAELELTHETSPRQVNTDNKQIKNINRKFILLFNSKLHINLTGKYHIPPLNLSLDS